MNNRLLKGYFGLCLVTIVLLFGFFSLNSNLSYIFGKSDEANSIVLDKDFSVDSLEVQLLSNGIFEDPQDARCVAMWLKEVLCVNNIENLGALNKEPFLIPAHFVDSVGGYVLKQRLNTTFAGEDIENIRDTLSLLQSTITDSVFVGCRAEGDFLNDSLKIELTVEELNKDLEPKTSALKLAANRLYYKPFLKKDICYHPVSDVLVRIREYDTAMVSVNGNPNVQAIELVESTLGFAKTGTNGKVSFFGKKGHYYSLEPLSTGKSYGAPLGVRYRDNNNGLEKNIEGTRVQRPKKIRAFTGDVYSQIKNDMLLTVRTKKQFKDSLVISVVAFVLSWWIFIFLLGFFNRKHKTDYLLPLLLMTLCGIGLLTMFSIANPLTDTLMGPKMVVGNILGLGAALLLSLLDFSRWFNTGLRIGKRYLKLDPLTQAFKHFGIDRIPEGFGYLVIVLFVIFLLWMFGTGPEGSGTRVNLFGFQPSEINKFLCVILMAFFFAVNGRRVATFSGVFNRSNLKFQILTVLYIGLAMSLLLGLYVKVMSDMGSAVVFLLTFIFLYSIARRDFGPMILGVITFSLMLFIAAKISGGSKVTEAVFALLWLIGWCVGGYVFRKKLFESAIFMNLIVSAFIFGGAVFNIIGMESNAERLEKRIDVAANVWDNDVDGGGDQVANGLWAVATGGVLGQGLGKGNPNLIPAFHTDMILNSIAEESGLITIVLILLCYALLIHRSFIIAYKARSSFSFYLASGIATITGIQLFVILFGSMGVLPLTGVAVPFLSYGKSSLIFNLAAFGIVLAIAKERSTENQRKERLKYGDVVSHGILVFLTFSALAIALFAYYQITVRDETLVRPAYVNNNQGIRLQEYNPRIPVLLCALNSGSIYDRNGLILATSSKNELYKDSLFEKHLDSKSEEFRLIKHNIDEYAPKRLKRYYPFGAHTFFMLGDYNTKVIFGISSENNPYGLMAEERFMDELRGFSTAASENGKLKKIALKSRKKSLSPFYHPIADSTRIVVRDYSSPVLLSLLKSGMYSGAVERWNREIHDKDLYLTLDAKLQMVLQEKMASYIKKNLSSRPKLRASVVILDALSGDLLTSANYPLPNQDTIKKYADSRIDYSRYEKNRNNPPFTDRDLGLTFRSQPGSTAKVMSAIASIMKDGDKAFGYHYHINEKETVEPASNEPNDGLQSPPRRHLYPRNRLDRSLRLPDNCSHSKMETNRLVDMRDAIVWSSNCYFINTVHNNNLYPYLSDLYKNVGISINGKIPYYFSPAELSAKDSLAFSNEVESLGSTAVNEYRYYIQYKHNKGIYSSMANPNMALAWGQSVMDATPLAMARVASIVANDGVLIPNRYVLYSSKKRSETQDGTRIIDKDYANVLYGYMKEETGKHRKTHKGLSLSMGGKTGTPERELRYLNPLTNRITQIQKINDGWYICFVDAQLPDNVFEKGRKKSRLAIAVRLERLVSGTSGKAVDFVEKAVINALKDCGYILE